MRAATLDDRLEAIAGPPGFTAGDASEGTVDGSISVGPFSGRSYVLVYDADGTISGNYPSGLLSTLAANSEGSFRFQWNVAGNDSGGLRSDFLNGSSNFVTYATGARALGRHVLSIRTPEGLGAVITDLDGSPQRTSRGGHDTGDGIPVGVLRSGPVAGDITRVAAFAWPRFLTDGEVLKLHHWLAHRFSLSLSLSLRPRLCSSDSWELAA